MGVGCFFGGFGAEVAGLVTVAEVDAEGMVVEELTTGAGTDAFAVFGFAEVFADVFAGGFFADAAAAFSAAIRLCFSSFSAFSKVATRLRRAASSVWTGFFAGAGLDAWALVTLEVEGTGWSRSDSSASESEEGGSSGDAL